MSFLRKPIKSKILRRNIDGVELTCSICFSLEFIMLEGSAGVHLSVNEMIILLQISGSGESYFDEER